MDIDWKFASYSLSFEAYSCYRKRQPAHGFIILVKRNCDAININEPANMSHGLQPFRELLNDGPSLSACQLR